MVDHKTNEKKKKKKILLNFPFFLSLFLQHVLILLRKIIIHLHSYFSSFLTFPVSCTSESCIEIKIKWNFYFHTSLRTTKKCENKNLT